MLLALGGLACRRAGHTTTRGYVPLHDEAATSSNETRSAAALESFSGGAPRSSPQGEPVRVAFALPKLGTTRTRRQETAARFDEVTIVNGRQKLHRELTHKRFRVREEIDAIEDGRVSRVRAVVLEARELMDINDKEYPTTVLDGEYLVDLSKVGRIVAQHASGRSLTSREQDELGDLYAIDAGDEPGLVKVLHGRPLRLGESNELTAAERELVAGAEDSGVIALTLVEVANDRATYQLDATPTSHARTKIIRTTRERHTIRITTGELLEAVFDTMQSEHGAEVTGELRARTHVTFE